MISPEQEAPSRVLVLTGTCGSGKSSVAALIATRERWLRVSEDDVWQERFHKDRGRIGTPEHRQKRAEVHDTVFRRILDGLQGSARIIVDATIHEAPPDSFRDYAKFFADRSIPWRLRVLHPRLNVAIARDAARDGWHAGAAGVTALWLKFTTEVFGVDSFVDTSNETAVQTAARLLLDLEPSNRQLSLQEFGSDV